MRRVAPLLLIACCLSVTTAFSVDPDASPAAAAMPRKMTSSLLPNGYQLTDKVFSGGLPETDEAFEDLRKLGIKTVISVDGATPDVAMAKRHDLRYVHLPHGYDGISDQRVKELAKAVRDLPGPIYIHCHHGKHRSPAAAAAACITAGMLAPKAGEQLLSTAGTSKDYRGLYQAVENSHKISAAELDKLKVEFHEVVPIPALAEAMVAIEHTHDHLKQLAKNEWQPLPKHPDLDPAHEALLLKEHFTELRRTKTLKNQPVGFQKIAEHSQLAAEELESALRDKTTNAKLRQAKLDLVTSDCTGCHKQFRDIPLGEKGKK